MQRWEQLIVWGMVLTAVVGTAWYLYLEFQRGDPSLVGWSLVAVVWFVVLRRLVHLWMRDRGKGDN